MIKLMNSDIDALEESLDPDNTENDHNSKKPLSSYSHNSAPANTHSGFNSQSSKGLPSSAPRVPVTQTHQTSPTSRTPQTLPNLPTHQNPPTVQLSQTGLTPTAMTIARVWLKYFSPPRNEFPNSLIMLMARSCLDWEKYFGHPIAPNDLREALKHWFTNVNWNQPAPTFEASFEDFCRVRSYVKKPLSEDPLWIAWKKAISTPFPHAASTFSDERLKKLLALCFYLSQQSNGEFFLGTHQAANFLGVDPTQVSRWLKVLQGSGIIAVVAKYDKAERKATLYEWLA